MYSQLLETYDRGIPAAAPHGKGSGAVNDAGAEWYTSCMRKMKLPRRDDPGPPPPLPETTVEGLRFPGSMVGTNALNYVLTQTPGKLKPKDLKEAIRKQRELRATQKREQDEARARTAGGASGAADDPATAGQFSVQAILAAEFNHTDTRQIKEMAFLQDIQDIDKEEKEREFKSSVVFIGEPLMTGDHLQAIKDARHEAKEDMGFNQRQEERMRSKDAFLSPYSVPAKYGRAVTEVNCTKALIEIHKPTFDIYKNDLWRKRKKQLARLVYLVGQWITRRRVARRLAAIKEKIGGLEKAEVKELVELDFQKASNNNVEAKKKGKTESEIEKEKGEETDEVKRNKKLEEPFVVEEEFVVKGTVPMFEEDESTERMPVTIEQKPLGFLDLSMSTLRVGVEAVEHGYSEVDYPQIDLYVPLEESRPLREGAFEEYGVRMERDTGNDWANEPLEAGVSGVPAQSSPVASPRDKGKKGKKGAKKDSPRAAEPEVREFDEGDKFLNGLLKQSVDLELRPCLPETFKTNCKIGKINLLRHDSSVRVYAPVNQITLETDRSWDVRPRFIPREVPVSIGRTYSERVGSSTIHAHRNIQTISESWRPRRERRGTALAAMAVNTRQGLWEVKDLPLVQSRQASEDFMSDSESDGEVEPVFIPSMSDCKDFFSSKARGGSEGEGEGEGEGDEGHSDSSGRERGEGGGDAGASDTIQVMRDRKMLELERKQRERRCELASRLPDRMKKINGMIANSQHLLFLQTPFHRLAIQYPDLGDKGKEGEGNFASSAAESVTEEAAA